MPSELFCQVVIVLPAVAAVSLSTVTVPPMPPMPPPLAKDRLTPAYPPAATDPAKPPLPPPIDCAKIPGDSAPVVPNWLPVEISPMLLTSTVLPSAPPAPAPLMESDTAALAATVPATEKPPL